MKTLTIIGMHCNACEKLIMMELEEAGLDSGVQSVEVYGEAKKGVFHLDDTLSDETLEKITSVINAMEGYSVE